MHLEHILFSPPAPPTSLLPQLLLPFYFPSYFYLCTHIPPCSPALNKKAKEESKKNENQSKQNQYNT